MRKEVSKMKLLLLLVVTVVQGAEGNFMPSAKIYGGPFGRLLPTEARNTAGIGRVMLEEQEKLSMFNF